MVGIVPPARSATHDTLPSVTEVVDQVEEQGLIERRADPDGAGRA